ncbi:hypothetical protein M0R45_012786 [Rubus argutus]|uniref:Transcription initiation factor IIF subunit alpha n=1 Tax=Rubus argutus TaxID=59490 RepID=A0AAW1XHM2_RUBAR
MSFRSGAVSEEEIRPIMMQKAPISGRDFIDHSPGRFRSYEEKVSLVEIMRKMDRMQKINGINHVIFREGFSTPTSHCVPQNGTHPSLKTHTSRSVGAVSKEEIRAVLMHKSPITTRDLVNNFPGRIRSKKEKEAFTEILRKMSRIQKVGARNHLRSI